MLDIKIVKTEHPKQKPQDESKLGFGKIFSDHMFVMDYTAGEGWHDARVVPYGPWEMDPATTVFHYAQEIFEGMKAYRTAEGKIQLFRPDCNANRFNDSADRLGMPPIPPEDFVQAVKTLVDVDRDWVPHSDGASLYIRPFCIATDVGLGVHAAKHYRFAIIAAPSGAYYAEGLDPVRIYVEDQYIRAAPGLTGFTKCGGNYAASIKAGELAAISYQETIMASLLGLFMFGETMTTFQIIGGALIVCGGVAQIFFSTAAASKQGEKIEKEEEIRENLEARLDQEQEREALS